MKIRQIKEPKNLRSHEDFTKWKNYKERFYWWFFLWCWYWDKDHRNLDDYIIRVKCTVKGIYTPLNRGYDDFCIKIEGEYFKWKYDFSGWNSTHIFRTEDECRQYYKQYFNTYYNDYIIDYINRDIDYNNETITRCKNEIETDKNDLMNFLSDI